MSNPYREGALITLPSGKKVFIRRKPGSSDTQHERKVNTRLKTTRNMMAVGGGVSTLLLVDNIKRVMSSHEGSDMARLAIKRMGVFRYNKTPTHILDSYLKTLIRSRNIHVALGIVSVGSAAIFARKFMDYHKALSHNMDNRN